MVGILKKDVREVSLELVMFGFMVIGVVLSFRNGLKCLRICLERKTFVLDYLWEVMKDDFKVFV